MTACALRIERAKQLEPREPHREVPLGGPVPLFSPVFTGERRFFGETRLGGAPHDEALRFELAGKGSA